MDKLTKLGPGAKQPQPDQKGRLLGERHEYRADETATSLAKSARLIGFSKSETAELKRLYDFKSRGRKK